MDWCKGHATQAMIRAGITSQSQAKGNGHADRLADKAHDANSFLLFLLQEYETRHLYLARVIHSIFKMIASICRDANERMDQAKKNEELKVLLGFSDNMRTLDIAALGQDS